MLLKKSLSKFVSLKKHQKDSKPTILLGWGVVQVGLSFQSHDPSQRSQGCLTLAGGLVVTFAKEILDLITA